MAAVLWCLQLLLALFFGGLGVLMLAQSKQELSGIMAWVEDFPAARVRLIGGLEVAAALGLLLPGCSRVLPWLVPAAATGLVVLMVLAALTHRRRGERRMLPVNAALAVAAGFVAILRFGPYSW